MIEYSTSAKDALKIVSKNESISEEMRILYVALTRAKEKLIITATTKDYQKDIDKKKDLLKIYKGDKIHPIIIKKYLSYYDWLQLVFLNTGKKDLIDIKLYSKKDVLSQEVERESAVREFNFEENDNYEEVEKEFSWKYENEFLTTIPIKSTVSKVKEMQSEGVDFDALNNSQIGFAEITPNFLTDNEKISSARRGTLMHLLLQKLDLRKDYTLEDLIKVRQDLVLRNIISEEESNTISLSKIDNFLNSDLAQKMKNAKSIEQEKAFCIKLSAKEIYDEATNETILVQGIIDLYAILDNNEIILVDYKTDYVENNEEELVLKYSNQLRIYKKALEISQNLPVKYVYIYSLYLNKAIKVDV